MVHLMGYARCRLPHWNKITLVSANIRCSSPHCCVTICDYENYTNGRVTVTFGPAQRTGVVYGQQRKVTSHEAEQKYYANIGVQCKLVFNSLVIIWIWIAKYWLCIHSTKTTVSHDYTVIMLMFNKSILASSLQVLVVVAISQAVGVTDSTTTRPCTRTRGSRCSGDGRSTRECSEWVEWSIGIIRIVVIGIGIVWVDIWIAQPAGNNSVSH